MKPVSGIVSIVLAGLVGFGGGILGSQFDMQNADIPRIKALDIARIVQSIPPGSPDKEAIINQSVFELRQRAQQLVEEGYIVIDGSLLFDAPEHVYVQISQ